MRNSSHQRLNLVFTMFNHLTMEGFGFELELNILLFDLVLVTDFNFK